MNPSERIDQLIAGLTDWRGKTLASIRRSILDADREIIEEWKWMGKPSVVPRRNNRGRQRPQGCELKMYEGAAHGLFITHAERFNHDVLRFITA